MKKSVLIFLTVLAGPLLYGQLIPYREGKKWGFISYETQDTIVMPKYKSVDVFSGSFAAFQKERKFGYLNIKGEEAIKPIYQSAGRFICGMVAPVTYRRKRIYINTRGEETKGVPIDCGARGFLSYGKILRTKEGKQGYALCCPLSDTIVPPKYDYLIQVNHTNQLATLLFIVQKDGHWGIVDTANTVLVPFEYDTIISRPDKGMLLLRKNGLYGAYGLQTRFLIAPQYISATAFSNYMKAEIRPGIYGYVDDKGRKYWK